jgi:hypothetical protein
VKIGGQYVWAERLDAASNLPTIDARPPRVKRPKGGWPKGTRLVGGRPVRPIMAARRGAVGVVKGTSQTRRQGASRERRGRRVRRTRGPTRGDPSGSTEGDGEGPPPPGPSDVAQPCRGGLTNSRSTDARCPPWSVGDAGLDTVVFGWRDPEAAQLFRDAARERRSVWDGPHLRLADGVAGMTLGSYQRVDLVVAEARLAAILSGGRRDHRLIHPDLLADGALAATRALASVGVTANARPTVRRADLAAELCFADSSEGLAFLHVCQRGLHLGRLKQAPRYATGDARLESITWHTPKGRKTRIRLYDAGAHHGTHAPGHRFRLEVERRWAGNQPPTPSELASCDLAALFRDPLKLWLRTENPLTVETAGTTTAFLYGAVRRGELTLRRAASLNANANALAYCSDLLDPHDRRRRVRILRDAGIAVARPGDVCATRVDIREPLLALVAAWEHNESQRPVRATEGRP